MSGIIERAIENKRVCMFAKTAWEFWGDDPEVADIVTKGVKDVEEALYELVVRGQKAGEIPAERDPRVLAQFLTGTYYGLQVLARANPHRETLENIASTALTRLN